MGDASTVTAAVFNGLSEMLKAISEVISLDKIVKEATSALQTVQGAVIAFVVIMLLLVVGMTVGMSMTAFSTWETNKLLQQQHKRGRGE
jgi:CHASE3 domain sensor protein